MNGTSYSDTLRRYETSQSKVDSSVIGFVSPYVGVRSAIFEVGPGLGHLAAHYQSVGHSVHCVDIFQDIVDVCKELGLSVDHTTSLLSYLEGHPAKYDLILMIDVLEHIDVEIQVSVLTALTNLLNDGGVIVIRVPNADSLLANRYRYIDFTHKTSYTLESLSDVARNSGCVFDSVACEELSLRTIRGPRSLKIYIEKALCRWFIKQYYRIELNFMDTRSIVHDLNLMVSLRKTER
jgi:2-polyprenyl-3-methyl-5-hydroxy-6-metoxy-1,4-benzoquinol methylase